MTKSPATITLIARAHALLVRLHSLETVPQYGQIIPAQWERQAADLRDALELVETEIGRPYTGYAVAIGGQVLPVRGER